MRLEVRFVIQVFVPGNIESQVQPFRLHGLSDLDLHENADCAQAPFEIIRIVEAIDSRQAGCAYIGD